MRVLRQETDEVRRAFQETFADNIVEVSEDPDSVLEFVPESGVVRWDQRAYEMSWPSFLGCGFSVLKRWLGNRRFIVRHAPEVREETYVPIMSVCEDAPLPVGFTERDIIFRLALEPETEA